MSNRGDRKGMEKEELAAASRGRSGRAGTEDDDAAVEELLRSAQDEITLKLSIDSHISKTPNGNDSLLSDLRRRFAALKSAPASSSSSAALKSALASSAAAAQSPRSGSTAEAEIYVEQLRQLRQQEREAARVAAAAGSGKVLPKSVSVGMGFMGRIDEDKACEEFEEEATADDGTSAGKDNVGKKGPPEKYPRSKSYAPASKRLGIF